MLGGMGGWGEEGREGEMSGGVGRSGWIDGHIFYLTKTFSLCRITVILQVR